MDKKTGFVLFEKWHSKRHIGSSRIRGHWLIKNWNGSEVFEQGKKYDVVIFQKTYWVDYAKIFDGVKILDICDPDWLDNMPVKEMADCCDVVTVSTEALGDTIKQFTDKPVVFIPDRQDLDFHNVRKQHVGRAKKVIWFGYSHNVKALDMALSIVNKLGLKLTVLSCCRPPYANAHKNIKYDWDNPEFNFNQTILEHDFVILPPDLSARGKFKSKNKTYTAWALGMPVANTRDDVERFMDPIERQKEADLRFEEVKEKYEVKQSVKEFKDLIEKINENKRK